LQYPFAASKFTAYAVEVYLDECAVFVQRGKLDNGHRHFVLQAEEFGAG
jgi:hypothetical protein